MQVFKGVINTFKRCKYNLHRFYGEENSSIMIIFAFFILPLMAVSALGVEIGRLIYLETSIAQAVDAAAVAVAKYEGADPDEVLNRVFFANYEQGTMGVNVTPQLVVSEDGKTIDVEAEGQMSTVIGKAFGIPSLRAASVATAKRVTSGIEVSIAYDISAGGASGSQEGTLIQNGNSKMNDIRIATHAFLDVLYGGDDVKDGTKVSIVPYGTSVNVGSDKAAWLADPATLARFPSDETWKGCLMARFATGRDETDDTPATEKFMTYFAASTWPHHAQNKKWDNDWTGKDGGTLKVEKKINNVDSIGPNRTCPPRMLPLTKSRAVIGAKVDSLEVIYGGGRFPSLGAAWTWRNVSGNWGGIFGGETIKPIGEPNNVKAVILLPNGTGQWFDQQNALPEGGDPTAYYAESPAAPEEAVGRVSNGTLGGATTLTAARVAQKDKMLRICENIKNQGITVYVVAYKINAPDVLADLEACASVDKFLNAEKEDGLIAVFEEIARDLKRVRIIK